MQDLVAMFLENVQSFLGQAREQENAHNEKMMECASSTLEKAAKNELDEDMPDDLKMVNFSWNKTKKQSNFKVGPDSPDILIYSMFHIFK